MPNKYLINAILKKTHRKFQRNQWSGITNSLLGFGATNWTTDL